MKSSYNGVGNPGCVEERGCLKGGQKSTSAQHVVGLHVVDLHVVDLHVVEPVQIVADVRSVAAELVTHVLFLLSVSSPQALFPFSTSFLPIL